MVGKRKQGVWWVRSFLSMLALGLLALPAYIGYMYWEWEYSGPYYNSTALADFEGDGDQDVVVVNLRKESDTTFWHVTTFWTNQGNRRFTPEGIDLGPYLYLSAAAGDLDRDGDDDIAILSVPNLVLYLNQEGVQSGETGVFKIGQSISPMNENFTISSVQLGDLNGDGNLDAFVSGCSMSFPKPDSNVTGCSPAYTWVWINKGRQGGRLGSELSRQAGFEAQRIRDAALGDLNGDGDLDVFAAVQGPEFGERTGHPDLVFLNDGTGNFHDSSQQLGSVDSSSVTLGDLDGDEDLDALVGFDEGAKIWINQGGMQAGQAGEFAPGEQFDWDGTVKVFLEDLNRDGHLDALVGGKNRATIWWNDGQGSFTLSYQRFRYSERHALAVGDFDGDGYPDIFAAAYQSDYRVWYNDGEGLFK